MYCLEIIFSPKNIQDLKTRSSLKNGDCLGSLEVKPCHFLPHGLSVVAQDMVIRILVGQMKHASPSQVFRSTQDSATSFQTNM